LERKLLDYDYINVGGYAAVDLVIADEGQDLVFKNRGREILRTTVKDFFPDPGSVLSEFSVKSDRHAFFRISTYYSLLMAFPIILYICLYTLFRLFASLFVQVSTSSMIASILCLFVGIALFVIFNQSREKKIEVKDLKVALNSGRWQKRVAALRTIQQKGIEIADFQSYQNMPASPHTAERYWLVKALGVSRRTKTYKDLLAFLDDSQPNVVCMAFYALGQRGDRRAVKEIVKRIKASGDWYKQWYAYRALRNLGWRQTKSR
jgi:hypothetical protein